MVMGQRIIFIGLPGKIPDGRFTDADKVYERIY